MKRIVVALLLLFLSASAGFATTHEVTTAKILAVKAHEHGRIAYWEGRVPIFDDYPFYDITLAVGQKKYVVRYESPTGYYPSGWKVGSEVKVRQKDKGTM